MHHAASRRAPASCLPECIEEAGIAFYRLFPFPSCSASSIDITSCITGSSIRCLYAATPQKGAAQQIQFHFRSLLYLHRQNTLPYSLVFLSAAKVL